MYPTDPDRWKTPPVTAQPAPSVAARPALPMLSRIRIGNEIYFYPASDCGLFRDRDDSKSNVMIYVALDLKGPYSEFKVDSWTDRSGNVHTYKTLLKQISLWASSARSLARNSAKSIEAPPIVVNGVLDKATLLANCASLKARTLAIMEFIDAERSKTGVDPTRLRYLEAWRAKAAGAYEAVENLKTAVVSLPTHPSPESIQVVCAGAPELNGIAINEIEDNDPAARLYVVKVDQGGQAVSRIKSFRDPDEEHPADVMSVMTPEVVQSYGEVEQKATMAVAEIEKIGLLLFDFKAGER